MDKETNELTADEVLGTLKGTLSGEDVRDKNLSADALMERAEAQWDIIKKFDCNPTVQEYVEYESKSPEGTRLDIPMRILSGQEVMDSEMEAMKAFNEIPSELQVPGIKHWRYMIEILYRAMSPSPQNTGSLPFLSKKGLMQLPLPVLNDLFRIQEKVQDKYTIDLEELTNEEFEAIIDTVKKSPESLKDLDWKLLLSYSIKLSQIYTSLRVEKPTQ